MNKKQEILKLTSKLKQLVGHNLRLSLYYGDGGVDLTIHGCKTWEDAVKVCQELKLSPRKKSPGPFSSEYLHEDGESNTFRVVFDGFPPTCHKETYTERFPKTETRIIDGEFIEVTRTRVVCSDEKPEVDHD